MNKKAIHRFYKSNLDSSSIYSECGYKLGSTQDYNEIEFTSYKEGDFYHDTGKEESLLMVNIALYGTHESVGNHKLGSFTRDRRPFYMYNYTPSFFR